MQDTQCNHRRRHLYYMTLLSCKIMNTVRACLRQGSLSFGIQDIWWIKWFWIILTTFDEFTNIKVNHKLRALIIYRHIKYRSIYIQNRFLTLLLKERKTSKLNHFNRCAYSHTDFLFLRLILKQRLSIFL